MNQIQKTVYKVSDFLSWNRSGSLILSPAFQRRPVWPKNAKSLLLDTIVRGIPMPIIFIRQRTNLATLEPQREVVDGQQRLRTIISFIEPQSLPAFNPATDRFTMEKFHNTEYAEKQFKDLPVPVRQRILDYDFSVHVLPSDTDDRDVLQIFGRMNSTGYKLNEQELRNAEFFGQFKELMYQLAYEQLNRWRAWKVFTETDIARMLEVEETSDIVITIMAGIHGKNQKGIHGYYAKYDGEFDEQGEVGKRFRQVMDLIEDQLGRDLPTLVFHRKPLFHSLFAFYYDLTWGLKSPLTRSKAKPLPRNVDDAVRRASDRIASDQIPEDLAKLLRGATGHLPSRQKRLEFLKQELSRATRK